MPDRTARCVAFAVAAVAACVGPPGDVTIALAYDARVAAVAEAALAERQRPWDPTIHVVTREDAGLRRGFGSVVEVATTFAGRADIVGVVGPEGSGDGLVAAPVYNASEVPHLLPTANASALASVGPWTFLMAPTDSAEAVFAARRIRQHFGAVSVTVFYVTDGYGRGLADAFVRAAPAVGLTVSDRAAMRSGRGCGQGSSDAAATDDFHASMARARPQVIFAAVRNPEALCIVPQLRALGENVPVVFADGVDLPALWRSSTVTADSLFAVSFWNLDPADTLVARFLAEWEAVHGPALRPANAGDALAYDAIMVLGEAIRHSRGDRASVRRYLRTLGGRRPAYQGITGPVTFPMAPAPRLHFVRATADSGIVEVPG